MLSFGHSTIVACYLVVTLALLLLGLFSSLNWRMKAGLIALVSLAWCAVYFALPSMLGWPTDRDVPRRFNLVAVYIQEPDLASGHAGGVFFWASDLDPDADQRPRAYKLPFSPSYKSVFEESQGKLRQNIPQVGETEEDDELHGVPADRLQLGQRSVKIKFRDAPPSGPPSKDAAP
jgi:membrane-bound metal-dependent hydrolase YbcI (DUF457 family)